MSAAAEAGGRAPARRRVSPRLIGFVVLAVVLAAMALDTTYKKPGETTASGRKAFDPAAAGEQYGKRQGSGPYSFSTSGEGVAGKAEGGLLPVRIKGVPKDARISIQI